MDCARLCKNISVKYEQLPWGNSPILIEIAVIAHTEPQLRGNLYKYSCKLFHLNAVVFRKTSLQAGKSQYELIKQKAAALPSTNTGSKDCLPPTQEFLTQGLPAFYPLLHELKLPPSLAFVIEARLLLSFVACTLIGKI